MNWRFKATVQRLCAALPVGSDALYYGLQRQLGSLRNPPAPTLLLRSAVEFSQWLRDCGIATQGLRCLEVGTGRRLDMPFGLFLLGAATTHTYDVSRYLKSDLVLWSLEFIRRNRNEMERLFADAAEDPDQCRWRLASLLQSRSADDALRRANVVYHAPADAGSTGLDDGTIDLHYSYTVDEHIPPASLVSILTEARRVLSPAGVVLHHIDPSDHFSHDDSAISPIHFLRYTDKEWARISGNKYSYHNRLRAHEHVALFETSGFEVIRQSTYRDPRAVEELQNGFPLAPEFKRFTVEQLSGTVVRVLARPRSAIPSSS